VPFCNGADDALCAGASPAECTDRALFAWSEARDDRAVECVARTLTEACALDDARACGFAGRLWLDGRGVSRDAERGLGMLVRACDSGVAVACAVAVRWLADPHGGSVDLPETQDLRARLDADRDCAIGRAEACYQVGLLFYTGRDSSPRDHAKSARAYSRGCDLGDSRACNNFADALAYGEGTSRDLEHAAATFDKACRLGEALGCSNLGYCAEHGAGVRRDLGRARALYRDACATGDPYGCLHAAMLVVEDAGAPREPTRALPYWVKRCAVGEARACAFVGIIYEDGPDGLSRDEAKSQQAMSRACKLGEPHACQWAKGHSDD
jgi:TPR repeat protein